MAAGPTLGAQLARPRAGAAGAGRVADRLRHCGRLGAMSELGERPEERVVVPDDVIPAGRGPQLRRPRPPADATARRGSLPMRYLFIGLIVAGVLLVLGASGLRGWWAHRLHDITGGSEPADFVIGVFIGALPLIGVALGRIGTRGARRVMRMFLFGAAGFVVSYLLSPSISRYATDRQSGHIFDQQAPGYLWGVVSANVLWLLALVFAWWRFRQWRRSWATRRRGPV